MRLTTRDATARLAELLRRRDALDAEKREIARKINTARVTLHRVKKRGGNDPLSDIEAFFDDLEQD